MNKKIGQILHGCGLALLTGVALLTSWAAQADNYPDRPISLVVAYSPGGATDFQARIVTMMSAKSEYLGQPMVIINKPGAGGQVGWNWFASEATKDGYDLAAYNLPHFIAQSIVFDTKYDIHNLEPIANWGADPAVLIVPKDSPFNSAKELVAYAKKNPGKITVSGAGLYVGHHIATLQLEKAAGIKLSYVPTKGGVPAMQYVIGHKVMAGFNNLSDAYRNRDRLKILAIADLKRNKEFLPDVPTFKEEGIDVDDSSVNFRGIMAPKGTPEADIDFLAKRVPEMFRDKKVEAKMKAGGSPMDIMTRDEVMKMWERRQGYLTDLLAKLRKKK
jgi:tripartite-type tricarboxylate transporter receptor subunit TctC